MNACVVRVLKGEAGEMAGLQRVLEAAPTYYQLVTGLPPGRAEAESTYAALPPGKTYEDKFVFGILRDDRMVGCADLIRGYPDARTAQLGLLLVAEPFQGQGIGRAAYDAIESFARSWGTCERMRIGVVATNAGVMPFWLALGFIPTGEVKPYRYASLVSEVSVLVKPIAPPGPALPAARRIVRAQ